MTGQFALLFPLSFCFLLSCSSSSKLANWEFTGGPSAQNISTVFIDEENKSFLLAGLTTGEVFSSTNGGFVWKKAGIIRPNVAIYCFVRHPENRRQLFASTEVGLFVSTDDGETWNEVIVDSAMGGTGVRSIAIEPYNTNVMYTGVRGRGLYKSTDGGKEWRQANGGLDSDALAQSDVYDIKIDPSKPDVLYAAVRGIGVVKTTDGGDSWLTLTSIIGSGGIVPTAIVVDQKSSGAVCFGMEAGSIYKSIDGGETWSPTRFGSGSNKPVNLAVHPGNASSVYAGVENDILLSTDFGTTWKSIANELPHVATTLTVASGQAGPVVYAFGEGIGLKRTTNNGTEWMSMPTDLGGSTVLDIEGNARGDVVYAVAGASVHRLTPRLRAWVSASNTLTGGAITSLSLASDSSSFVYAATATGVFNTTNAGESWSATSLQMRGKPVQLISTHPIFKTRLLCVSERELFISTDRGVTWNPTKPLNGRYHVHSFTFSNADAGFALGATRGSGAIVSTNGGLSWEGNRYGLEGNELVAVTLDEKDKNTLYAWTEQGGGFRSTNRGLVWDRYSSPWQSGQRFEIALDPYMPSDVVALVGNDQLYYSRSGGATWFSIPVLPLKGEITSTYWNARSATLYAGIRDVGVYRISLDEYLKRLFEE